MTTPAWKMGALNNPINVNVSDLINSSRNFYNNRFDILDQAVGNLQTQKNLGQISDMQFINQLQDLATRQKGGFVGQPAANQVTDLQNQAQTAVAQQVYNDYIAQQKAQIQKTLDSADLKYAAATDDYQQGKINRDQYLKQRDAYFNIQKTRADLEQALPKFSYEQFAPGKALNTYQSGRMRDIQRESAIKQQYSKVFGNSNINQSVLDQYAGSYLDPSAINSIFQQQKLGKMDPNKAGLESTYRYTAPAYNFGGTGGRAQLPGENISPRNIYK